MERFLQQAGERAENGDMKGALAKIDLAYGCAEYDGIHWSERLLRKPTWPAEVERHLMNLARLSELAGDVAEQLDDRRAKKARTFASGAQQRYASGHERLERERSQQEQSNQLVLDRADQRQRVYRAPRERVFSVLLHVVAELSYTITHTDRASGIVSFNTGISMLSWAGQNVTVAVEAIDADTTRVVIGGKTAQAGNPFSGGGGTVYTFGELKSVAGGVFQKVEAILINEGIALEGEVEAVEHVPQQDGLTAQLERLADLRARGALSDEEFSVAKAKLLD